MKRILIATAALGAMTTVAIAAAAIDTTRGAVISGTFRSGAYPTDPLRGEFASTVAKTLPPNPVKDAIPGGPTDGPLGSGSSSSTTGEGTGDLY